MKIGYVLDRFPSLHQTFVLSEMLALEARGRQLTVFSLLPAQSGPVHAETLQLAAERVYAPRRDARMRYLAAVAGEALRHPGRFLRSLAPLLGAPGRVALGAWLRGLALAGPARRAGIEHFHAHFATGANVTAMTLAALCDRPFSFTTHAVGLYARPVLLPASLARARFHVTISEYNRRFVGERYGAAAAAKTLVIRDSVDAARFAMPERAPSQRPLILSIGRLVPKKGHATLVDALALLAGRGLAFEAEIVGDGPLAEALRGRIAEHGLEERVRLRGALNLDGVRQALSRAEIYAMACTIGPDGDRDGIPVSIMEAMAAGLPIVSTTVSGIGELVEPSCGRLVAPDRPADLAEALAELLGDPAIRRSMGHAAARTVARRCDIREAARMLDARFEDAGTGA